MLEIYLLNSTDAEEINLNKNIQFNQKFLF